MNAASAIPAALLLVASAAAAQVGKGTQPPQQPQQPPSALGYPPRSDNLITSALYLDDVAPDFELESTRGGRLKLSRERGRWVMLAFSDRKEQLAPLGVVARGLDSLGFRMLGVCREKPHNLRAFATRDSVPFVMMADAMGEIAALYGLWDRQRSNVVPGVLMLNPEGVVRLALVGGVPSRPAIMELARSVIAGETP